MIGAAPSRDERTDAAGAHDEPAVTPAQARLVIGAALLAVFVGSLDQVKKDIEDVKKLGADEIFFMIFPDGPIEDLIATMERYRIFA